MPDLSAESQSLVTWLQDHALSLVFWGVVLLVVYRLARPAVHKVLLRVIQPPTIAGDAGPDAAVEVEKRVATLEDLFAKLIHFGVVVAFLIILLSLFDAWSIVAGLGLVAAALTLAGQSIVLDYLTGILLFVEGPYFKGDVVILGGIEGTVEEVGLRRTIVRDVRGTVHSISNGVIRIASNETRMYAATIVEIGGIAVADVERVIAVMNEVGLALVADDSWAGARARDTRLQLDGRLHPERRHPSHVRPGATCGSRLRRRRAASSPGDRPRASRDPAEPAARPAGSGARGPGLKSAS